MSLLAADAIAGFHGKSLATLQCGEIRTRGLKLPELARYPLRHTLKNGLVRGIRTHNRRLRRPMLIHLGLGKLAEREGFTSSVFSRTVESFW